MSLQSLCVVQSFVHGITASLEHSLHLYDTALQKLREDVEDHDLKLSKETLATIVVLSTTEVMFLNRVDNSWQIHARGISEILKLRGHIVETSDTVWHNLCSRLQTICVLDGLIQRRSLLLTPDCWRKLQGKLQGSNGVDLGKFDQLIDIASEVPVLLEETEGLLERPLGGLGSSPMQGVCLMRTFACILRRLCTWQERLRTNDRSDRPLYWTVPSALSHSNQIEGSEVLFPRVLEFRSLNVAIPLLFAWAIRVQIYDNLIRIYSVIGRASSDIPSFREIFMPQNENFANNTANEYDYTVQGQVDPTFDDGPSMVSSFTEADRLSRLICQGLEYCHKSRMGLLGPQCTTFPSWAIRNYFRHHVGHERELQWCQGFRNMRGEGSRCGIETMTFTDIPDGEFRQVDWTV
ncbi:hypothetical protein Vi05172_g9952 [Venturia inaequalis]|nr:hypothetical protein Vi05172_g9952 [Venturia inaequalis]